MGEVTTQQEASESEFIGISYKPLKASKDNEHPPPHKLLGKTAQRPDNNQGNNKRTQLSKNKRRGKEPIKLIMLQILRS